MINARGHSKNSRSSQTKRDKHVGNKHWCERCRRWKLHWGKTPLDPGWRCDYPQRQKCGGGGVQRKWDKLPSLDFRTLGQHDKYLLDLCVSVRMQACSWTIKTEDDPFIKKGKKKQHTRGEAYVVEWGGGAKEISPKDAMHLVVVLWIIVSFSFYYKFEVSL